MSDNSDLNTASLDEVFIKYGYEVKNNYENVRVYILRQGMYYGAEIIPLNDKADTETIVNEFTLSGFTCMLRKYNSVEEAEDKLFEGFFNTRFTGERIKRKYKAFTQKQIRHATKNAEYKYINSPFRKNNNPKYEKENDLVADVMKVFKKDGPQFVIIEASAGFGKTCTAYEVLRELSETYPLRNPLFTELSRNRQAKIFKYVLLSEIEEEFHSMMNSELVTHHIRSGRIPLIIDGFDELLSKDQVKGKNEAAGNDFEQVETMLSTIADLLHGDAKIIMTSRKTALFSGEEFFKWVESYKGQFNVERYIIKEPRINDWLDETKIEMLEHAAIPIKLVANPVLLSYMRYVNSSLFARLLKSPDTIVNKYFQALLEREQIRQNLLLDPSVQLRIFKRLAISFAEFNITSEERSFVKELIIEYSKEELDCCREAYEPSARPTLDELANTLTNHALLDRIGSKGNNIGFINDFVFGTLIGQVLIEKDEKDVKNLPENIVELAVISFKFQNKEKQLKLWNVLSLEIFKFSDKFKLIIDLNLKEQIFGDFDGEVFESIQFKDIKFDQNCNFKRCVFNDCKFSYCSFDLDQFEETSFMDCNFWDCSVIKNPDKNYLDAISTFGCVDSGRGFIKQFDLHDDSNGSDFNKSNTDYKRLILEKFFKVDGKSVKMIQISHIENEYEGDLQKIIAKEVHGLSIKGLITLDGDKASLTSDGISYFHKNY